MNQDNHHFYGRNTVKEMTVKHLEKLVDFYAQNTQVAAVLFCVNVQRALFNSEVWERFYDGSDEILRSREHGAINIKTLYERNINHFQVWLDRCRFNNVEGFLSMRMNDIHGLYAPEDSVLYHWPTEFWKNNPHLRRIPYDKQCPRAGAFDYGKQEIRNYHLKFIKELFERFDFDGFEMDWLRRPACFAPGSEFEGRAIISDFIAEVRTIADSAAKRRNHKIQLAHRVPADLETCLDMGLDVITWSAKDNAGLLCLCSSLNSANFDYSIDVWKAATQHKAKIITHADCCTQAYPGPQVLDYEFVLGSAEEALMRGADGIYLFNECYRQSDAPELLKEILTSAGNLETLQEKNKRFCLAFPQETAEGESVKNILPVSLIPTEDFQFYPFGNNQSRRGTTIMLKIPSGRANPQKQYFLRVGFSKKLCPEDMSKITVRINTNLLEPTTSFKFSNKYQEFYGRTWHFLDFDADSGLPNNALSVLVCPVPCEFLKEHKNSVEIVPPQIKNVKVIWAEILSR